MNEKAKLKKAYRQMIDWNTYRLEQNRQSLDKLVHLLSELDRDLKGSEIYEKDVVDLDALKIIYETGIRSFESQVDRYNNLISDLD